jgi:hypothetical protein
MTVWIYVENAKQVGDRDHLKVFSSQDAAQNGSRKTILKVPPSSMQFRPTAQKIALWEPDVRRLLVE